MNKEKAVQVAASIAVGIILIATVNASAPAAPLESTATTLKLSFLSPANPTEATLAEVTTEEFAVETIIATEPRIISADEYSLTATEFDLIVRVVVSESGSEPFEGQCAVAQVIRDRLEHDNDRLYGSSVKSVLYKENQFAAPYRGDLSKYPDAEKAVAAVFVEGYRVFKDITVIFFNPEYCGLTAAKELRKYNYIGTVGDHEFYGDEESK